MKFVRRSDLDTQARIHIVMLAWMCQGVYGKMTQIAEHFQISRTFLYQMVLAATLQLEVLFSDEKLLSRKDRLYAEHLMLLLRLEGKCSIQSISEILKQLQCHPNSVGYLSEFFQRHGRSLSSTLSVASKKLVFYLSDEIFALSKPILVTIDAQSTAILKIELASDRSADTWKAHFEKLKDHLFYNLGMASDRALGLVTGYQAAFEKALWVCDYFHEFRGLFDVLHQLERKAYAAIGKEDEAAKKVERAKSEAVLLKRLEQYETVHQACDQAISLYDELNILLQLLRETLQLCSPYGRLHTVEGVRAELASLLQMTEDLGCAAIGEAIKPIKEHIDDILVPFEQTEAISSKFLEVMPQNALDSIVLAWNHDHSSHQSKAKKKRYHQEEREYWLIVAESILGDKFEMLRIMVFDQLDAVVRASSLVETVNSLIRPYINSCKGQITQEALNLIMFYHNHHRYKSGRRKGKTPIELLTGEPLEAEWVDLLLQEVKGQKEAALNAEQLPMPPAALEDQVILENAADSERLQPQINAKAA